MRRALMWLGSTAHADQLRPTYSPYDHRHVGEVAHSEVHHALEALRIAQRAFTQTQRSPLHQRCAWLLDVASKLDQEREFFAQLLCDEVGKPITFARIEVTRCIETITLTAETMRTMHGESINTDAMASGRPTLALWRREAAGVVVAITPFNFPLNLVAHKLAPALVAGNSVVLKPTPEAPLCAYHLARLFIQSPYAITDALSVIYGDAQTGSALVSSSIPRVISFTGSVGVGEIITRHAGIKKVSLELGGNAATYIDESADIPYAAARCALGAFVNSGQVCISLQRIYVHEAIYESFAEALAQQTQKLVLGSPYDEATFLGPLINEEAAIRALRWVHSAIEEGAKALTPIHCEGRMFAPCVMSEVEASMAIVCEEVFAPIVSLIRVGTIDEAIMQMNNSPYGLQFSLFSNRLDHTQKVINECEAGGIVINDMPTLRFDIQPYGGVKLSGIGREGPRFAIEEMSEIKSIVIL